MILQDGVEETLSSSEQFLVSHVVPSTIVHFNDDFEVVVFVKTVQVRLLVEYNGSL